MSSSRTLLRKLRTSFTCIKPRFDPSIILLYIAASVEQYCDITQVNALPENEGILEGWLVIGGDRNGRGLLKTSSKDWFSRRNGNLYGPYSSHRIYLAR